MNMKLIETSKQLTISLSLITALTLGAQAGEKNEDASYAGKAKRIKQMEKDAPSNPLKNAYFGETHLHTSFSLDAYIGGNRMLPSDSYRFAKGEEMTMNGKKHKLERPLDFAAVTDHAEYIGEMYANQFVQSEGHDKEELQALRKLTKYEDQIKWFVKYVVMNNRGTVPKHTSFFPGE